MAKVCATQSISASALRHFATFPVLALLITGGLLYLGGQKPTADSPRDAPLMRREPRIAAAAAAAATEAVPPPVAERPAEWGRLMRREGGKVGAAAAGAA
eukprot:CAMPEP_0171159120 /NCGR_PEP_ID=MMETSP0790-20130122/2875_1 /TAXON_ID=2925 /ORGANISM="Alexandrium catenella, Strain OF101" /LENGTH=99 /DNA_ID=CAMNT_0011623607 /DNA_START=68 /DNA_END=363 /DNA_ORIENTATION=+